MGGQQRAQDASQAPGVMISPFLPIFSTVLYLTLTHD